FVPPITPQSPGIRWESFLWHSQTQRDSITPGSPAVQAYLDLGDSSLSCPSGAVNFIIGARRDDLPGRGPGNLRLPLKLCDRPDSGQSLVLAEIRIIKRLEITVE